MRSNLVKPYYYMILLRIKLKKDDKSFNTQYKFYQNRVYL